MFFLHRWGSNLIQGSIFAPSIPSKMLPCICSVSGSVFVFVSAQPLLPYGPVFFVAYADPPLFRVTDFVREKKPSCLSELAQQMAMLTRSTEPRRTFLLPAS